jgi:hypothetical protein
MRPNTSAPSSTPPKRKLQLKKKLSKPTTPVLPRRLKKPKPVKTKGCLKPWLKSVLRPLSSLTKT